MSEVDELIKRGVHVLIIQDALQTTVQPVTDKGYEALRRSLIDADAPTHIVEGLSSKKHGHYNAAIPVENPPHALAKALISWYGIPDGGVAVASVEGEITPILLGEQKH